jgi:hypothetical protein
MQNFSDDTAPLGPNQERDAQQNGTPGERVDQVLNPPATEEPLLENEERAEDIELRPLQHESQ